MNKMDFSGVDVPEKEKKILEAAIKIFAEKGFSAGTTSEIAKEAGVAEGTIFRYFKTKKDILRNILLRTISLVGESVVLKPIQKIISESDGKDLREVLREIAYDRIKLIDNIFPIVKIVFAEAILHQDMREILYESVAKKGLETFKTMHIEMAKKGLVREDKNTVVIFRCILSNIIVLIIQRKIFPGLSTDRKLEDDIEDVLDVIIEGIGKD